jgi:uncharacterized protein (TIGR04222 family)
MLTTATTWGISSAQFLIGYGLLCVAAAAAVWWEWRHALGPQQRGPDALPELGLYELALLGGGPHLAITSALAQLHHDKRLRVRRREGTLKVAEERTPAAEPFERAVYDTVRSEPGISIETLRWTLKDSEALESLSARLTQAGLLVDEEQSARVRRLWIVGALLAALGIARVAAGLDGGAAVGGAVAMVLVVALATSWLFRHRPLTTKRGRDALERQRAERDDLRRHPPASESAMTVALFGGGALWLADPAVAAALGVPREEGAHTGRGRGPVCGGGAGCSTGGANSCASSSGGGGGGCGGGGCGGGN